MVIVQHPQNKCLLGVVDNLVGAIKPPVSIVVVMKTFYVSTISLLDQASFFKIICNLIFSNH
jgi:hypothetical protein